MPADSDAAAAAADVLRDGGLVAFPTETVYGLGASTFDAAAIECVYAFKGRPADNPLIAHIAPGADGTGGDPAMLGRLTAWWTRAAERLAQAFWPGPLAMILPRHPDVPSAASGGRPTIAIRCPRHPAAIELLRTFGGPISAPSANRSGHLSPTCAADVAHEFAGADLMVIDGGRCVVGLESTVVDLTVHEPRILRPGSIGSAEIAAALDLPSIDAPFLVGQAASPGTRSRHYAPEAPIAVCSRAELPERLAAGLQPGMPPRVVLAFDARLVPPPHLALEMPQGAGHYAARLYAAVREADGLVADGRASGILIVEPPDTNEMWKAVRDRLRRMDAPG
ncbi:MAG: L-threonylcarbamoyladenylate synthase [Phycisphaerales bacterium]